MVGEGASVSHYRQVIEQRSTILELLEVGSAEGRHSGGKVVGRRPKFRPVPGIQLDRDQTILNNYKLNKRSKKRIAATLRTEKRPLSGR